MARNCTNQFLAALQKEVIAPAVFVEAHFDSGPVYIWTGIEDISWNNVTWRKTGSLLNVSSIEEGADVHARGITISLSGIDNDLLKDCLNEFHVGLPAIVRFGLFDSSGSLIPDPVVSFSGRMDEPTIDVGGKKSTISVACESRLIAMNTPVAYRYTNQDQQLFYPGDLGCSFVNAIQSVPLHWGQGSAIDGNA